MKPIDLRSDTVTKPTPGMLAAMNRAEVGDDVYGEDPTVNHLESLAAEMLGTEAAIFVSSGTQGNLLGILTHCGRGDEYIVGQKAHTYWLEGGGPAVLGSVQPQPLDFEADGTLDLDKVASFIKPDDFHCARTRLLCLENTKAGLTLPLEYLEQAAELALNNHLKLHLDGARIFNAAVKQGIYAQTIAKHFDSISFCLSKGLGAPVGSVLCGSQEQIKAARRWRKVLGGGMRQAGYLAAAGVYALENNVQRLAEDHDNAALLARGLSEVEELVVEAPSAKTNMVFVSMDQEEARQLTEHLKSRGIIIQGRDNIRLVTHLDVSRQDILTVLEAVKGYFANQNRISS